MNDTQSSQPWVMTVMGPVPAAALGITDGHTHTWIEPVPGTRPGLPVLFDQANIGAELGDFRASGGRSLVDCQPGGCGRNGRIMRALSESSDVQIVTCTGFHLRRYYPPDAWIYLPATTAETACAYFVEELTVGLRETQSLTEPVLAGFIKIACEAEIAQAPDQLLEAAAQAGRECDVAMEVHTEKGADAEKIVRRLAEFGFPPNRLIICHIDKRPDFGLHRELAQASVTLEYDTFYREKYQPERNVWPLLEQMVAAGLDKQVVIATDMAEAAMWTRLGGQPGQTAFTGQILPQMQEIGFEEQSIQRLMGGNIARLLARPERTTQSGSRPMPVA